MLRQRLLELLEYQQRDEADYEVSDYAVLTRQIDRAQIKVGFCHPEQGFYLSTE